LKAPPELLARYCRIARPLMNRLGLPTNSCIGATNVSCYCMERLGFKAIPFATKFVLEAPSLEIAYTSGLSDAELAQGKCVKQAFGNGWRGHLVAHVEDAWLLDTTFDQADDAFPGRPFGLAHECVMFPLEGVALDGFLADYRGYSDATGMELRVRYASLKDESWRQSEAWMDEALPFVAELILAQMRYRP
jgi:hypothetical protein